VPYSCLLLHLSEWATRLHWLLLLQTVANFYLAFEQELSLLPLLNKVDLPD
jgi:hypothetical protein